MTGNRPAHLHWGTCGNSTVVWAALNKLPFAIGFTNNMSYRYTMCHHLFQHFLLRARRIKRKISVQEFVDQRTSWFITSSPSFEEAPPSFTSIRKEYPCHRDANQLAAPDLTPNCLRMCKLTGAWHKRRTPGQKRLSTIPNGYNQQHQFGCRQWPENQAPQMNGQAFRGRTTRH